MKQFSRILFAMLLLGLGLEAHAHNLNWAVGIIDCDTETIALKFQVDGFRDNEDYEVHFELFDSSGSSFASGSSVVFQGNGGAGGTEGRAFAVTPYPVVDVSGVSGTITGTAWLIQLTGSAPGPLPYTWGVNPDPIQGRNPIYRDGLDFPRNGDPVPLEVNCGPTLGSVGDFVWLDSNGDGIQDDTEVGVPNVDVFLLSCDGNVVGPAVMGPLPTGLDGEYLFTDVPEGRYAVKFNKSAQYDFSPFNEGVDDTKDSDAEVFDGNMGTTACFDLPAGGENLTLDAGLYEPASLGDFVWNDLDEDGVQDDGEPGVNGVTVSLTVLDCSDDSVVEADFLTTMTANNGFIDGFYEFTDLMPGCYKVTFSDLPDGFVFTQVDNGPDAMDSDANPVTGMTGTIELSSGANDPTNDAGIYEPATAQLGNFVWTDNNADGIQDGDDLGIDGALVELFACENDAPAGAALDNQNTGAGAMPDGGYLFDDLAPGDYAVKFTVPDDSYMFSPANNPAANDEEDSDAVVGGDPTMGFSHCVTLDVGDINLTVDAGIFQKAMIGDYVWLDENRDGIQDPDEDGLNGVEVALYSCDNGVKDQQIGSSMITANGGNPPTDGYYKFMNLMPGEYIVMFMAPDGLVFSPQNQTGDAQDSDADADGNAACTFLVSGENDPTWDAGLNEPAAPGINLVKLTNGTDNNSPTGPFIPVGDTVTWTYIVTNTGNEDLRNVTLNDDLGTGDQDAATVTCYSDDTYTTASDFLPVDGTLYCRLIDDNPGATAGQYMNLAEVCGEYGDELEPFTTCDDDPDHYYGATASIDIRKQNDDSTNVPGDLDDVRTVGVGSDVTFTITVTNTGDLDLENVTVSDLTDPDGIDDTDCMRALADLPGFMEPDASVTFVCTISDITIDFMNEACVDANVDGQDPNDPNYQVMDCDMSQILVVEPGVTIEKCTVDMNGFCRDADTAPPPAYPQGTPLTDRRPGLLVGTTVTFNYDVSNNGSEPITGVVVSDNIVGVTPTPVLNAGFNVGDTNMDDLLDVGETWSYTATGTVEKGPYANIGSVVGEGSISGTPVDDEDPSHHIGLDPQITIQKATNGEDADAPTGPEIAVGGTATFTYVVDNPSNEGIKNVVVVDDNGTPGDILDDFSPTFTGGDTDGDSVLDFNETWTYTDSRTVTAGQYTNISTVTGKGNNTNKVVTDEDPSNHFGLTPSIDIRKQVEGPDTRTYVTGSSVTFTIVVKNTGPVALTDVIVSDPLATQCDNNIGDLAVGGFVTYDCTIPVVDGSFVNEACVTGVGGNQQVGDCDPSTVEIIDIDIRKQAEGADSREFSPGDDVTFNIVVENTGDEDLFKVEVTDEQAPQCDKFIGFLAAGNEFVYSCTVPAVSAGFENIACVDGFRPEFEGKKVSDCDPSTVIITAACELTLDKMCFVSPLPPSSNFTCDKPIDSLTMIWTGSGTVTVKAWKGDVGSTLLGTKDVSSGEEVTFTGFAGSPNNVYWEIFSGGSKIGESQFHLSCSDDDMDGETDNPAFPNDCGKAAGNGKDNGSQFINDWILEGMVDNSGTLDCTVDTTPVFADACEFTGQPLPSCENGDKPDTLTWRYDGGTGGDGNCADSTFPDIGHDDFECAGSVDTGQSITVEDDDGNIYVVNPGDEFTVNRDAIGSMSLSNGGGTQAMAFHASCSQPLEALATAGALTLVALDDRRADREVQYAYTVTNNSTGAVSNIDVTDNKLGDIGSIASLGGNGASMTLYAQAFIAATTTNTATAVGDLVGIDDCVAPNDSVTVTVTEPPASCAADGKPTELEFTLGSGLCSDMNNSQGDKAKCSGGGKLDDIDSVVMTKDASDFDVSISGDSFVIAYDDNPGDKMPSTIKFRVTDSDGTRHDYELHTSCSVPLAEGDIIGGLEITNFVPEY